ncbi:MAG TPA: protein phosphatase CheZ [Burkholderiales bacterium]|nr:protein phosphatase CheZ [Burkholderiales bacterium]
MNEPSAFVSRADPGAAAQIASEEAYPGERLLSKVGQMTRTLHDSLRELGYDKAIEKAAAQIPDARDRMSYIASMTEKAAERSLTATEIARPIQDALAADAAALDARWQSLFERKLTLEQFRDLVGDTRSYLAQVPQRTGATNAQLTEIMMAQDFQDLTGQVIKRVTAVTNDLESQLVQLLVENVPPEHRQDVQNSGLMNGPVIRSDGRADVVTDQKQVDDLLESLGF